MPSPLSRSVRSQANNPLNKNCICTPKYENAPLHQKSRKDGTLKEAKVAEPFFLLLGNATQAK